MGIRRRSTHAVAAAGAAILITGLVLVAPSPASAAGFQVTSQADSGLGSLRDAIQNANASPGADTITFAPGVTSIDLLSEIAITEGVNIQGPGMGALTIGRGTAARFDQLSVSTTDDVTVSGLTVGGTAGGAGLGIRVDQGGLITLDDVAIVDQSRPLSGSLIGDGAGMLVTEAAGLTLTGVNVLRNTAQYSGGVSTYDVGTLTVQNSTFSENADTEGYGGALYVDGASTLNVTGSTFTSNTSADNGGGIYVYDAGNVSIEGSTFTSNDATSGEGGAIWFESAGFDDPANSTVAITNNVFSQNTAALGGGAMSAGILYGRLLISDVAFTSNSSSGENGGGAIRAGDLFNGFDIERSIFTGNAANEPSLAGGNGGAASFSYVEANANLGDSRIVDSSFTGNTATGDGGAVEFTDTDVPLLVSSSTFTQDSVLSDGLSIGADRLRSELHVVNSTMDETGIPIYVSSPEATVYLESSTVVAPGVARLFGGGLRLYDTAVDSGASPVAQATTSAVTIGWSALTDSPVAGDFGSLTNTGGNQFGLPSLLLGPLAHNGGYSQSRMPLAGSPLIDQGDPAVVNPPARDQNHNYRVFGPTIDIGSSEVPNANPNPGFSTLTFAPSGPLVANGTDAYTVTATARYTASNLVAGTLVTFRVPAGATASSLSCMTAANGTCSITVTSTTPGTYGVTASLWTGQIGGPIGLKFTGAADTATSTIVANPTSFVAGTPTGAAITVTLRDQNGDPLGASSNTVTMTTDLGELTAVTNNGDGTYTATLTSEVSGDATVGFSIDGAVADDTALVIVTPGAASTERSTIEVAPSSFEVGGSSTVTVKLRDAFGNPLTASGDAVTMSTTLGQLSAVVDNGDGTYTSTLTSSAVGIATLTFAIDDEPADATAVITVTPTGLALTGAVVSAQLLASAALLLVGGIVLFVRRRIRA